MKYDFTTIMDRRGMDAIAVDKIPYENVQVEDEFSDGADHSRGGDRENKTCGVWLF